MDPISRLKAATHLSSLNLSPYLTNLICAVPRIFFKCDQDVFVSYWNKASAIWLSGLHLIFTFSFPPSSICFSPHFWICTAQTTTMTTTQSICWCPLFDGGKSESSDKFWFYSHQVVLFKLSLLWELYRRCKEWSLAWEIMRES